LQIQTNKQTNKQTNADDNTTDAAQVIMKLL